MLKQSSLTFIRLLCLLTSKALLFYTTGEAQTVVINASRDTVIIGKHKLYGSLTKTNLGNDSISFIFSSKDSKQADRFYVSGVVRSKGTDFFLRLNDSLVLNYKKYSITAGNNIIRNTLGLQVNNFNITGDSSKLSLASKGIGLSSLIDVDIVNFDIAAIAAAFSDTLSAEGKINGKATLGDLTKKLPSLIGDISINSFKLKNVLLGDVKLLTQKAVGDSVTVNMSLAGNGNEINTTGKYYLNRNDQLNLAVDIKQLQASLLQQFLASKISRTSGKLFGKMQLTGKLDQPRWQGEINFDSTTFSLKKIGTLYFIDSASKLVLNYPDVCFTNFTIYDSLKNPLVLNGNITAKPGKEYVLSLDAKATNFTFVNAPKAISNSAYGFAAVDAKLHTSGTLKHPIVEGNIYLDKNSDINLVLPDKNIDKYNAASVVRFIDRDTFNLPEKRLFRQAPDVVIDYSKYINKNLIVEVDKSAVLTIFVDPSTGDEIRLKGGAKLNAGIDSAGKIVIAGKYYPDSGYYSLNYQFLDKRFDLLPGSSIEFTGDPLNAKLDMKAVYITNTSPKELLDNETGDVDENLLRSFNEKIPFQVILGLNGTLKKMKIGFDIRLPDGELVKGKLRTTVENKLKQLREDVEVTKKQVFALLALDRFVGEQSTDFFKGSNSNEGMETEERESVSKFLTASLDQMASDLFKGINIDLNLKTYKDFKTSDGSQKAELNVDVSKSFLDDRLNVVVGKDFGIEGQDASAKAAQQKGRRFLPGVTTNYKLSKDGKYKLKSYKKSPFELVLDGYVFETGINFIVTLDYDFFLELFTKARKE